MLLNAAYEFLKVVFTVYTTNLQGAFLEPPKSAQVIVACTVLHQKRLQHNISLLEDDLPDEVDQNQNEAAEVGGIYEERGGAQVREMLALDRFA